MIDLIDRNAAIRAISAIPVWNPEDRYRAQQAIEQLPNIPAEPVRRGRWVFVPETEPSIKRMWWDCSECGKTVGEGLSIMVPTDYCPRCGAEMEEI